MIVKSRLGLQRILFLLIVLVWLLAATEALASQPEYIESESPVPDSVKERRGVMWEEFREKVLKPPFLPQLKKKLETLPPFWRDTKVDTNIRSYYFYRDNLDNSKNEAWALGGWLDYRSGWYKDRLRIGASGYTSQKLYGPSDRDGTKLLKPGQESFTVLGEAYLEGRIVEDFHLRVFRQAFNLPYVNKDDSRMVPNTFEAYTLLGRPVRTFDFIVSHVTRSLY